MACIILWRSRWQLITYQFHETVIHSSESHFTSFNSSHAIQSQCRLLQFKYSGQVHYQKSTKYQCYSQSAVSNRKLWKFPSRTSKFRLRTMFNKSFRSSFTSIISSYPLHQPNQLSHSNSQSSISCLNHPVLRPLSTLLSLPLLSVLLKMSIYSCVLTQLVNKSPSPSSASPSNSLNFMSSMVRISLWWRNQYGNRRTVAVLGHQLSRRHGDLGRRGSVGCNIWSRSQDQDGHWTHWREVKL